MAARYMTKLAIHHYGAMDMPTASRRRLTLLRLFVNLLMGVILGTKKASAFTMWANTEVAAKAAGSVTFATASGAVGAVINGVTVTVTWTADIASMTALMAAVNASVDPFVQYQVQATNTRSLVTLTSTPAGAILRLGQFNFTAVAAPALVQNWGDFDISGSDTADALALATAINQHPQASKYWVANSAGAVVSVFLFSSISPVDGSTSTAMLTTNTAIAIAAQPVAGATGCIASYARDRSSNAITLVASGTGVAVTGTGRLTGGSGANQVPSQEVAS